LNDRGFDDLPSPKRLDRLWGPIFPSFALVQQAGAPAYAYAGGGAGGITFILGLLTGDVIVTVRNICFKINHMVHGLHSLFSPTPTAHFPSTAYT